MSGQYRYPGAKPFSAKEVDIFYGREKQIEQLSHRIANDALLVLFGKSGLGKSSLLNAGLTPRLQKEQGLVPFNIRFKAFQSGEVTMPAVTARSALNQESALLDQLVQAPQKSLWYQFKAFQLNNPEQQGILLILDQFEELFSYPDEAIEAFARELAELLYTN
ncbi:MAG: ATP-binding protein, partial [Bacteroidota bacterium]